MYDEIIDLTDTKMAEREHQPREHAVTCRVCFHTKTWEWNAVCTACQEKQA